MDIDHAIVAFSALSQETRLKVLKMLIEYGREGAPAGALSDQLGIPHNTLSFHLSHLAQAGLVTSRKKGRSVIYTSDFKAIENLIGYLKENCCIREDGQTDCLPKADCC